MGQVAAAWAGARERHAEAVQRLEGAEASAALTDFLRVVALLARERRLTRPTYVARRS